METDHSRIGAESTIRLHDEYKALLKLLGQGRLLYNPSTQSNPSAVPENCEKTNMAVAQLLTDIKKTLREIKQSYDFCDREMSLHQNKMLDLKELTSATNVMDVDQSAEYQQLRQELMEKNKDLKNVIDEVQAIFTVINQISTTS